MTLNYKVRPLSTETDVEHIYNVFADPEEQFRIWPLSNFNSVTRFVKLFIHQEIIRHNDFFIIETSTGDFVGFIATYGYSSTAYHIKMMQFIGEKFRGTGVAYLSGIELVDWVFKKYKVNKIFTDIYGFNSTSLTYNYRMGFIEEGRLPEYRYYKGKFWDLCILSIDKDNFYKNNKAALTRFLGIVC